jgi:hypothetical protein
MSKRRLTADASQQHQAERGDRGDADEAGKGRRVFAQLKRHAGTHHQGEDDQAAFRAYAAQARSSVFPRVSDSQISTGISSENTMMLRYSLAQKLENDSSNPTISAPAAASG